MYLAALSLSCGTQDILCVTWNLVLWYVALVAQGVWDLSSQTCIL